MSRTLEAAIETLSQLTCERVRSELASALVTDDEVEIREALASAKAVLPLEELEEVLAQANEKLETLQVLRELAEASSKQALRAALQRGEQRRLMATGAFEVAKRKLLAIERLREAEQAAEPSAIEAALRGAKRLKLDPDLISSAEGILDRPLGRRALGLIGFARM